MFKSTREWIQSRIDWATTELRVKLSSRLRKAEDRIESLEMQLSMLQQQRLCEKGAHEWITRRALIEKKGGSTGINFLLTPIGDHILYCKHCETPDKTVVRSTDKAGANNG